VDENKTSSAGVLRDSFILRKTKEEIDQVTGSKVYGTLWLAEPMWMKTRQVIQLSFFWFLPPATTCHKLSNLWLDLFGSVCSSYDRKRVCRKGSVSQLAAMDFRRDEYW
jgi:hypothetical protein